MRIHQHKSQILALSLLLCSGSTLFAQASWTPLGSGEANDWSADTSVVCGSDSGGAFLWDSSTGQLGLGGDDAVAVSSTGAWVLGNIHDAAGSEVAGMWSAATGWVNLGGIGGSSGSSSTTRGRTCSTSTCSPVFWRRRRREAGRKVTGDPDRAPGA